MFVSNVGVEDGRVIQVIPLTIRELIRISAEKVGKKLTVLTRRQLKHNVSGSTC